MYNRVLDEKNFTEKVYETLLMQLIILIIHTTVYQFTPGIYFQFGQILWFTYNPKWLVMCCVS